MHYRNFTAEAPLKPLHHLRCQRNFRHEDDCLTTEGNTAFNRLKINFGFPAASYPVQQKHAIAAGIQHPCYRLVYVLLLRSSFQRLRRFEAAILVRVAKHLYILNHRQAFVRQTFDRSCCHAQSRQYFLHR
ncbi:hypothetical protein D3C77_390010 [compost metagenome]